MLYSWNRLFVIPVICSIEHRQTVCLNISYDINKCKRLFRCLSSFKKCLNISDSVPYSELLREACCFCLKMISCNRPYLIYEIGKYSRPVLCSCGILCVTAWVMQHLEYRCRPVIVHKYARCCAISTRFDKAREDSLMFPVIYGCSLEHHHNLPHLEKGISGVAMVTGHRLEWWMLKPIYLPLSEGTFWRTRIMHG